MMTNPPSADPDPITTAVLNLSAAVGAAIEVAAAGDTVAIRPGTYTVGAVIDKAAFDKITGYIDRARESEDAEIVAGGTYDGSKGYFIRPTIILAKKPDIESMCDEIFGPVVSVTKCGER